MPAGHIRFAVPRKQQHQMSLMVTSTSTPGSMEMEVICLTTSAGECKSIKRLWILSSLTKHVSILSRKTRRVYS